MYDVQQKKFCPYCLANEGKLAPLVMTAYVFKTVYECVDCKERVGLSKGLGIQELIVVVLGALYLTDVEKIKAAAKTVVETLEEDELPQKL